MLFEFPGKIILADEKLFREEIKCDFFRIVFVQIVQDILKLIGEQFVALAAARADQRQDVYDLLGGQKIRVVVRLLVKADDILNGCGQLCQVGGAEMPVLLFAETGILGRCLRAVEMNPQKFPRIIFGADVGVLAGAVEKKTVPGLRGHAKKGGAGFAEGYPAAAGEHYEKQVGAQSAASA